MTGIEASRIEISEEGGRVIVRLIDEISGVTMAMQIKPEGARHVMRGMLAATRQAGQHPSNSEESAA